MAKKPEQPATAQNMEEPSTLVPVKDTLSKDYFMRKCVPWDEGGLDGQVVIKLGNGSVIAAEWEKLPPDMQKRCAFHGLSQKLGDAAAGFSKAKDFASAYDAITAVLESLEAGSWNVKGDGSSIADIVKAIAKLKNVTVEAAEVAVRAMNEEQLAKVRTHADVKRIVAELRLERAKAAAATAGELIIPGL